MQTYLDSKAESKNQLMEFVIDILHYDIESMETLLSHLNDKGSIGWSDCWARDFTEDEILPVLEELCRRDFVEILVYSDKSRHLERIAIQNPKIASESDTFWFKLTDEGYAFWKAWSPPIKL